MTDIIPAIPLDNRQRAFAKAVAAGKPIKEAESIAGYASGSGNSALAAPSVVAAIELELRRRLKTEAAPLALDTLLRLVKEGSERIQVDAAKILLDRAGFVPPAKSVDDTASDKQLSEMTQEELHAKMGKGVAEIDRLEAELAARAKQVNTPNAPGIALEPSDLLD